jgi:hypothetical protein
MGNCEDRVMNTAEIESLLERVRKATGPDRVLSRDILVASGLYALERRGGDKKEWLYPNSGRGVRIPADLFHAADFHATSSMVAVVALIERALPGWAWKVGTCCVSDDAWLTPDFNSPAHGERLKKQFGYDTMKAGTIWDVGIDVDRRPSGHPQLALLEALLLALLHQASEKGMIDG